MGITNRENKTTLKVLETPFCGELRSKKFYMTNEILTDAEDYHDASGYTWCYHTHMPIGPDGDRAAPEYCTPGRKCYRSGLAEPEPWTPILTRQQKEEVQKKEKQNQLAKETKNPLLENESPEI